MITEQWQFGLVIAAFASNLLFVAALYAYRRRHGRVAGTGVELVDEHEHGHGHEHDVVVCPDCEAENERGYRYCRDCVSELPTAIPLEASSSDPLRRLT
jgi:hypothetical protein